MGPSGWAGGLAAVGWIGLAPPDEVEVGPGGDVLRGVHDVGTAGCGGELGFAATPSPKRRVAGRHSRAQQRSSAAGGKHDHVVDAMPAGAVERTAARDEAKRRSSGRAVHGLGRERRLGVPFGALHGELDTGAVSPHHANHIAGLQLTQPIEDSRAPHGVDVPGDDGRPSRPARALPSTTPSPRSSKGPPARPTDRAPAR